jgi:branched-chain amino acid transport system substrate-binding protein
MKHAWMRVVALLAVLAIVAAACGGGDEDSTTTEAAGGDDTTTTEAMDDTTTTEAMDDTTTTEAMAGGDVTCDEPVTVGLITDQTGALAIYGAHMLRGVPAGFEYATGDDGSDGVYTLDGCDIELIIKDDQSDAELSATAARELIEVEGADIIIGSVSSGVTATLQGIARETDTILIAAPAAANDLTGSTFDPNTFRASRNNYQDAMAICENLTKEYDTFVQIAPDYVFGYGGAQAYRDACSALGGEFPADDIFAPADTTDFTPYMEQIDAVDAEAILVTWAGGGFIPLLQAATDLGVLETKTLASPFVDNVALPAFFANAIGSTSSILYHYSFPDNPANDFLIAAAEEQGTKPDLFDADGMNAAMMVVEALKATGGAADADSLRDALEGLSFDGPKGTIEVRPEDHVAIQDMYIATLLNVDDPDFMFFEYVETVRPQPPCLVPEDLDRCGDLPAGSLTG